MTDEMNLAVFDPIRALTVKVQAEDAALEVDHTTADGEKALRSWVRTVRGYRAGLEKIRVKAKADALEYGKKVDGLAKELKVPFTEIIDARMKPLDEIEEAKLKAAEAIVEAERVAAEKVEADRLADLAKREKEVAAKEAEIKAKEDAANAVKVEAERVVREKQIAIDAAEQATKNAEDKAKVEANRVETARLATQDRIQREKDAAVEVERKRVADADYRHTVHSKILTALDTFGGQSCDIAVLLQAIVNGKIPHVTINY